MRESSPPPQPQGASVPVEGDKRGRHYARMKAERDAALLQLSAARKALNHIAQGEPTDNPHVFEQLSGDDCSLIARQALSDLKEMGE